MADVTASQPKAVEIDVAQDLLRRQADSMGETSEMVQLAPNKVF